MKSPDTTITTDSIQFSSSRGHMHVMSPGIFEEDSIAYVVANGGAQLMNSKIYEERFTNHEANKIIANNEYATAGSMLAYSCPQDVFVYAPNGHGCRDTDFHAIADSYERYETQVSRQYQQVPSVEDIQPQGPIIPNILAPSVTAMYQNEAIGRINARYYQKNIHQLLWAETGVPTPQTGYVDKTRNTNIDSALTAAGNWDTYVVNTIDGSGGYGIYFVPKCQVGEVITMLMKVPHNDIVQIQGQIPLQSSPCIIGNMSDSEVTILTASEQFFKTPGAHSGNFWRSDLLACLEQYESKYYEAFETLRKEGVRGQVNIDLLIPKQPTVGSDGKLHHVLVREANIRPAGSSVILRLSETLLPNGEHPDRIHTVSSSLLVNPHQLDKIADQAPKNLGIMLYNYRGNEKTASLAFLGNDTCENELTIFKNEALAKL